MAKAEFDPDFSDSTSIHCSDIHNEVLWFPPNESMLPESQEMKYYF